MRRAAAGTVTEARPSSAFLVPGPSSLVPRLDRLILAEVVPWFVGGVFLFTSLFFAAGELLRIAEFSAVGLSTTAIVRLVLLTLPYIVALTFPMAMLLAALLGFGRLSGDSEIVALVAAGTSFGRILLPVAVFAFFVSLIGLWFADTVVPASERARERMIDRVQETATGGVGALSGFTKTLRDKSGALQTLVQVEGGVNLARGELRDVDINVWDRGRKIGYVFARRATWKLGTRDWTLREIEGASLKNPKTALVFTAASAQTSRRGLLGPDDTIKLGTPDELATLRFEEKEVGIRALRARARVLRASGDLSGARAADVEVARRVALPFVSFIFALVGAPLGVQPSRAGKGVGFGLAVAIIFAYWISFQMSLLLGKSGALPPLVAAALPNVAGLLAAFYLNRRVLR